jgi:hypothetical protein
MGLDPVKNHDPSGARFERNHEQAQRSAREQIRFVMANLDRLAGPGDKAQLQAALSFAAMAANNETFTPAQLSYIDGLYERVMRNAGLPSVPLRVDRKRKGLRYG